MAFNTNVGKQQFSATAGQTDFDFNFAIFNDTDLRVYLTPSGDVADDTEDILTLSSDYSVSINGALGGTVELASGASLNDTVTIVRSLPLSRTTDYVTNGDLYADTLDADQDYQTYLAVDQNVRWERSLVLPESYSGEVFTLPAPDPFKMFRWNSTGEYIENIDPTSILDTVNGIIVENVTDLINIDVSVHKTAIVRDINRGGTFIWSATGTANGGTVFAGATGYWNRQYSGAVNVKWFGAKGDNANDDTVALQTALDYCKSDNKTIYISSGNYKITAFLLITAWGRNSLNIYGDGDTSAIIQHTDNTPIFKLGGSQINMSDMLLKYNVIQPVANTMAVVIAPHQIYRCNFNRVNARNFYAYIDDTIQWTGIDGTNSNFYFSCSFTNLELGVYSGYCFNNSGWSAGITGSYYHNIYTSNIQPDIGGATLGTAISCIRLGSCDDSTFNQINIEGCSFSSSPIYIDGVSANIVFDSLHIEGISTASDLIFVRNAYGITFNGTTVRTVTFSTANKAFMYVEGNVKVFVNGVNENGTTGTSVYRYRSTLTYAGSRITEESFQQNTSGVMTTNSLNSKNILFKKFGTNVSPSYELDIGDRLDATQKSIRVNGGINGSGNFDGILIGTTSSGTNNQIEFISNTDVTNSESWRIRAAGTGGIRIGYAAPTTAYSTLSYVEKFRLDNSGTLSAAADNTQTLGSATYRWSVVYAGTGTINTSDEREKTFYDIEDAETQCAKECKTLIKKYRFNSSIEEKGEYNARIHFGSGAQTIQECFVKYGLNPESYGIFCYDKWDETPEVKDEEGNVTQEYIPAGDRYGLRYDELLCFIISAL